MKSSLKQLIATSAVCALVFLGTLMIVGPQASPGTLAFKMAMRIYTGV